MKVKYKIDDGRILRNSGNGFKHVATQTDDGVEYVDGMKKFAPGIQNFIRSLKVEEPLPVIEPPPPAEFQTVEQAQEFLRNKGLLPVAPQVSKEIKLPWEKDPDIPPAPEFDPMQGDKTPAYVDWMFRWHPRAYEVKYGIEGPGNVTKHEYRVNPETGRKELVPVTEPCTLSRRKTHKTEKIAADNKR